MWYGWFMKSSKIVNIQPILLKIDTHIAWTYPMWFAKKWIDRKNVTYVSMETKIPIIKYREFLHISMCYISAINEDIASKFTPVNAREQMANSQKSNDLEMSRSRSNTSTTMKITFWAITLEPEVVETSGWLQNVSLTEILIGRCGLPSNKRGAVFASRDVKTLHFCNVFFKESR